MFQEELLDLVTQIEALTKRLNELAEAIIKELRPQPPRVDG
jgi:hypothetical protein